MIKKVPKHVAVIMDGNGRWAKKKNLPRIIGHKNGIHAVRETIEATIELGIPYLTLYTLSTENQNRPQTEIKQLMSLLLKSIRGELKELVRQNIKLSTIGEIRGLPQEIQKELTQVKEITQNNDTLVLTLALNYSGRWDIVNACKAIAMDLKNDKLSYSQITQEFFESYLTTTSQPPLDFLIRTSGEIRISNFLLWEIAYSELFFTRVLWPDFRKEHFFEAIKDFEKRDRRFGKA